MQKLPIALTLLWSIVFLPNGQYVVLNDGQDSVSVVSPTRSGGYSAFDQNGGQETVIPTGRNSYYQNYEAPAYQAPAYPTLPSYQLPNSGPDFRMKQFDWGQ